MADNNYATKQDLQELRTHMDERFRRVDARFDQFEARSAQFESRFDQVEARFAQVEARFAQVEDHLVERMRDMQTELLRAFHSWARPAEIKFRSHEERLTLLEERVSEIERSKGLS